MNMMSPELLQKYDVPAPRYTSYPTVPHWDPSPPEAAFWEEAVRSTFNATNKEDGISVYIHLPFCEKLCTYCGCNTRITINHAVEKVYMRAVLKEWQRYLRVFEGKPNIKEVHLGGGTPTFFSPENLKELLCGILDGADKAPGYEFSFEAHPGNTTDEHLSALYELGFRRISIGVQDFDPAVLQIINRQQTYEDVKQLTESARIMGFSSVNFDLIYGLPLQRRDRFMETIEKVAELRPDRIALYSYAHVPWVKPGQRKFSEADLPDSTLKLALYKSASEYFRNVGYCSIGMDHFALPDDELCVAATKGELHRNFMGYTVSRTRLLVGLGASAISDAGTAYAQNHKKVEDYYSSLKDHPFAYFKGHVLTETDHQIRRHILNIMCSSKTTWENLEDQIPEVYDAIERLRGMEEDGLVEINPFELRVTEAGQSFLRNICVAFDQRLWSGNSERVKFSQAV
jgi:oxygen-independent coproporphyrinogen-3 oxidase